MRHQEALDHLDSLIDYEIMPRAGAIEGLSVEPMRRLMGALGDPHLCYPVLHVTGTNGKSSTCKMIEALLTEMGLRVGTYSSPHLEQINERIRIAGSLIDDEFLGSTIGTIARAVKVSEEIVDVTWFETLTGAALLAFADEAVDVAVVEVGMLGRYDATNVVQAQVAVITNVSLDHSLGLPGWEREIAHEKAGIIESNSSLVLGETAPELVKIFLAEGPTRAVIRGADFDLTANRLAVGGRLVSVRTPRAYHEDVFVRLHGAHQGDNALTAIVAVEEFLDIALPDEPLTEAFADINIPGRLEVIHRSPLVVIDTAHNVAAAQALADSLDDFGAGRRFLVVGMQDGRDPAAVLKAMRVSDCHLTITTKAPTARGVSAGDLARAVAVSGGAAEPVHDVHAAVEYALAQAESMDMVVVAGSNSLAGAVRSIVEEH